MLLNPYRVLLFLKFDYPGFAPRAVLSGPYRAVTQGTVWVFDVRVAGPAYRAIFPHTHYSISNS